MITKSDKNKVRQHRHKRVRGKISGTSERPRLNVYRSNKNIYAQLIDDVKQITLASASTLNISVDSTDTKINQATKVGQLIAENALKNNISNVVFDRGGYLYHGRVKVLAEAAREAGLKF